MTDVPDGAAARWKKGLVRVGLSAVFVGFLLWLMRDKKQFVIDNVKHVSLTAWFAGLAVFIPMHVLAAAKWRLYLSICGAQFGFRRTLQCHGAGLFANLCLPSMIGGDVLRAGIAMRWAGSKTGVVLAALMDRLSDAFSLGLIVLAGSAFLPSGAQGVAGPKTRALITLGALIVVMALGLLFLRVLFRVKPLRKWPRKIARKLIGVLRVLRAAGRSPGTAIAGVLSGCAIQCGLMGGNIILARAMNLHMDLSIWLIAWPLAKLVAMLPISFAGIGVREIALRRLVTPLAGDSMGALAAASSLVWQTVLIAGGFLGGAFWKWGGGADDRR